MEQLWRGVDRIWPRIRKSPPPFRVVDITGEGRELEPGSILPYSIDGQGTYPPGAARILDEIFPKYFDIANKTTGKDYRKLALEGDKVDLSLTDNVQVVTTAYSLLCMDALERAVPRLVPPFEVARSLGFIIGAFRADVFGPHKDPRALATCFDFLHQRGIYMREDCDRIETGLANVSVPDPSDWWRVEELMDHYQIEPAFNVNDTQRRVGGRKEDLSDFVKVLKEMRIRAGIMSGVNGAFHTSYFLPSQEKIGEQLFTMRLYDPSIPLVSNTYPVRLLNTKEEVRDEIIKLTTEPVEEGDMMEFTRNQGYDFVYRIGEQKPFNVDEQDMSQIILAGAAAGAALAIGTVAWKIRTRPKKSD